MKLTIRNFRGVKAAEIDLEKIALVTGPNQAGKSSIAQALAALLLGDPVPLDGVPRGSAAAMIHAGAEKGDVALEHGTGKIMIAYSGTIRPHTEGIPPCASRTACGLESLAWMDRKERASSLLELLKAEPVREDLTGERADALWKAIQERGWDGAWAHAKQLGAELKGRWLEVTGEQYGSQKARTWLPRGWETDLQTASEDSLSAVVVQEREIVEAVIGTTAIDGAERDRLAALAGTIAEREALWHQAEAEAAAIGAEQRDALDALDAMPQPDDDRTELTCPHCNGALLLAGMRPHMRLEKAVRLDEAENTRRLAARAEATQQVQAIALRLRAAGEALAARERDLHDALSARDRLAAAPDAGARHGDIEAARERLRIAEGRLAAWRAKTRADRIGESIAGNAEAVALLASDGLRLSKMREALGRFNIELLALCDAAGWEAIEIEPDLNITSGGRSYAMLSPRGSERYRVRAILQIAVALRDESAAVILDGADILDSPHGTGLMRLLIDVWQRPALVCKTVSPGQSIPDLAGKGLGQSYRIDGGTLHAAGG